MFVGRKPLNYALWLVRCENSKIHNLIPFLYVVLYNLLSNLQCGRVQLKYDGRRWRTGGEVKGKLAIGVGSSTLHTTLEHGASSITTADVHTSAASSRLNCRPCRFKRTRLFRRKTKSVFCACAITFQTQSNNFFPPVRTDIPWIKAAGRGQMWSDWTDFKRAALLTAFCDLTVLLYHFVINVVHAVCVFTIAIARRSHWPRSFGHSVDIKAFVLHVYTLLNFVS
jgi:hypothetical protein